MIGMSGHIENAKNAAIEIDNLSPTTDKEGFKLQIRKYFVSLVFAMVEPDLSSALEVMNNSLEKMLTLRASLPREDRIESTMYLSRIKATMEIKGIPMANRRVEQL